MTRLVIVVVLLALATEARADLMADSAALVHAWSRPGVVVKRLTPVFLHDGETRRLPFIDVRTAERRCLSIVAIAERHQRFTLRTPSLAQPVASRAGVARIVDCGGGDLTLTAATRRVELAMTHGRGAIEVIRVAYAQEPTPIDVVVPERALGAVASDAVSTGALVLASMTARVARARRALALAGAETIVPTTLTATDDGSGTVALSLRAGCHQLHVVADTGAHGTADVDAEVTQRDDATFLDRDRSHAPDARLSFCLGSEQRVDVRFSGAPPAATVSLLDGFFPLPAGLPTVWGAQARAGLAWAVHRRRTPTPQHVPLFQSLGAPGTTLLPVSVTPGACYLAAFAIARGQASAGRLTVEVGARRAYDDANDLVRSAAVTFCAGPRDDHAVLSVDVRARDAWWVALLWRVGADDAL